jgi:uncharacterized protein YeaO (DUF488 family)
MIKLKRVYDQPEKEDGFRILVERLWPRGMTKEKAKIDQWLREVAPSQELRKWYGHDLDKWNEFQRRYREELNSNPQAIDELRALIEQHPTVSFVYAAKDEQHNSALLLRDYLVF